MVKKRTKASSPPKFRRACRLSRFPTEEDAVLHTEREAATSGIQVKGRARVERIWPAHGSEEAWLVEFEVG